MHRLRIFDAEPRPRMIVFCKGFDLA